MTDQTACFYWTSGIYSGAGDIRSVVDDNCCLFVAMQEGLVSSDVVEHRVC